MTLISRRNKTKAIDLHTHSTKSDGTCTPAQLVEIALKKDLAAFALTDHDNVDGIQEAVDAARGTGLEVVPGIELSTEYEGKDIHIVGLLFDYTNPDFGREIKEFADQRDARNQTMCDRLSADGYPVCYSELKRAYPDANITRAHFGQFLYEKGIVSSVTEAFDRLIGDDCPYFIPRKKITPQKAVEFLLSFNGLPILAHPLQYAFGKDRLRGLIAQLKECGLAGIEAFYSKHSASETESIIGLAREYDLLLSGGSDFHGDHKPGLEMGTGYGDLYVPGELLELMKQAVRKRS